MTAPSPDPARATNLAGIDTDVPNPARMYDYYLGGAHNFAADRERADQAIAVHPQVVPLVWANRRFLRHAVERLCDAGIDQFLDLGSGIPTVGSVHEVALARNPHARVAYVDNEPVAVAHSAAILADVPGATITQADIRDPATVLAAPGVADHLDRTRPIGLLAAAVLPFVADVDDPAAILAAYRAALAPGSILALTQSSDDFPEHPEFAEGKRELLGLYTSTSNPAHDRSRAEIIAIVETAGFRLDEDGLVALDRWAPPRRETGPVGGYGLITEPLPHVPTSSGRS